MPYKFPSTYDLYLRQMDLEPFVALAIRHIVSGHEIVRVHAGVHNEIEKAEKRGMATRLQQQRGVDAQANGDMMVDMEHGDLRVFLAQHKEQRLQQIEQLVEEEQIGGERRLVGAP